VFKRLQHINLFRSRELYGIEVNTDDQELLFRYVRVKNNYGKITVKSTQDRWLKYTDLLIEINRKFSLPFTINTPISLVFSGKQVVIRKLGIENADAEDSIVLQRILPGAKLTEFFFQKTIFENCIYVTLIRNKLLNELLEQFGQDKWIVINVKAGPIDVFYLKDEFPTEDMQIGSYSFNFNQFDITTQDEESIRNCKLGDITITNKLIAPFASVLVDIQWKFNENLLPKLIQNNNTELKFWHYQMALLRFFFVVTVFLIGTSYFINANYQEAIIDLQETTADQNNSNQLFQQKQNDYNSKVSILSSTGVVSSKNINKIGDRIGSTLPSNIRLLELTVFPLQSKIKKDKKIEFNKELVIVKGISQSSDLLNKWIETLGTEQWIKEITIFNYSQTDKQNPGIFELEILLNE
jgi:hypothetical protein